MIHGGNLRLRLSHIVPRFNVQRTFAQALQRIGRAIITQANRYPSRRTGRQVFPSGQTYMVHGANYRHAAFTASINRYFACYGLPIQSVDQIRKQFPYARCRSFGIITSGRKQVVLLPLSQSLRHPALTLLQVHIEGSAFHTHELVSVPLLLAGVFRCKTLQMSR